MRNHVVNESSKVDMQEYSYEWKTDVDIEEHYHEWNCQN